SLKRESFKRKKGRLNDKRPKSREETPKEGSDSARRYRTATICDRAAQSARVFELFSMRFRIALRNPNSPIYRAISSRCTRMPEPQARSAYASLLCSLLRDRR